MAEHDLRYFVDANMMAVGKALAAARWDLVHPGHPLLPTVVAETLDHDWIPVVGALDLVVITRDQFRKNTGEKEALLQAGLRVVRLVGKKDASKWDKLVLLVTRWDRMEQEIHAFGPGPWVLGIDGAGGFKKIA